MVIRVLIVDDHDLVRAGVMRLLADVPDIVVIGECATGEEALSEITKLQPHVILMDLNMPGIGGIEASKRIHDRSPEIKIIILTATNEASMSKLMLKHGVSGYLTKGSDFDEMIRAIKQVFSGQKYISPAVAQKLALSAVQDNESPVESLSRREMEVLMKISTGKSNREIAEELHLSPKTTSTYRARLLEKLGVSNDVELTKLTIQYGLDSSDK